MPAYYAGQLAPLQLTKEDEELLLALARGAEVAALGSEANLAALGAKRIATEVSKRLAFGLGKELQLNLAPGVEAPWQGWLPLPLRGNALVLRKIAEAELTLVLGTEWQYPVEAECGELRLSASLAGADRKLLTKELWRLEAKLFHRWQLQEWLANCQAGLLQFPQQPQVPVQMPGREPDLAAIQILVTLRSSIASPFAAERWGRAWLPLSALAGGMELRVPLEVPKGRAWLLVCGRWQYPLESHGREQRGRGLLTVKRMEMCGVASPPPQLQASSPREFAGSCLLSKMCHKIRRPL
ncbi:unnamed protein product [Effrenium voratum]|nr:unnamed protein product [Effrenium voratum]